MSLYITITTTKETLSLGLRMHSSHGPTKQQSCTCFEWTMNYFMFTLNSHEVIEIKQDINVSSTKLLRIARIEIQKNLVILQKYAESLVSEILVLDRPILVVERTKEALKQRCPWLEYVGSMVCMIWSKGNYGLQPKSLTY